MLAGSFEATDAPKQLLNCQPIFLVGQVVASDVESHTILQFD